MGVSEDKLCQQRAGGGEELDLVDMLAIWPKSVGLNAPFELFEGSVVAPAFLEVECEGVALLEEGGDGDPFALEGEGVLFDAEPSFFFGEQLADVGSTEQESSDEHRG